MPATKLMQFLDEQRVSYETIRHSPTYTAQKTAASAHVPGRELAKTVMIRVDGQLAMVVLPAPMHVDLPRLTAALGGAKVSLASESDFRAEFPDCEVGAMPPFGNLYGLEVYVDEHLAEDEIITFNACTHTDLVQVPVADYLRLVRPQVLAFAAGAH
jgi:Ala-tRNA(Pro) deacylase